MNNEVIRNRIAKIIEKYAGANNDDAHVAASEVMEDFDVRIKA